MSDRNPFAALTSDPQEIIVPDEFELAAAKLRSVAKGYWLLPMCAIGLAITIGSMVLIESWRTSNRNSVPIPFWNELQIIVLVVVVGFWLVGALWGALTISRLVHPFADVVVGVFAAYPVFTPVVLLTMWWYAACKLKQAGYRVGWFRAIPPVAQLEN